LDLQLLVVGFTIPIEPWKKLWNLGTNLKQLTSGPDGNKGGIFTGKLFVNIYYLSRVYP
jgi:hypothetical protein